MKILSFEERLTEIIEISYTILCNKIVSSGINDIENEASLQLQLSVIIQSIGKLYEFDPNDHFSLSLEKKQNLVQETCKSTNGSARCDIWLSLRNGKKKSEAAIELKYFKKSPGETTTDNRFRIVCDLENLEGYKKCSNKLICYEILYTDNQNYTKSDTASYLNIGQNATINGHIESNNRHVNLQNTYQFNWDIYPNHYFLKIAF